MPGYAAVTVIFFPDYHPLIPFCSPMVKRELFVLVQHNAHQIFGLDMGLFGGCWARARAIPHRSLWTFAQTGARSGYNPLRNGIQHAIMPSKIQVHRSAKLRTILHGCILRGLHWYLRTRSLRPGSRCQHAFSELGRQSSNH